MERRGLQRRGQPKARDCARRQASGLPSSFGCFGGTRQRGVHCGEGGEWHAKPRRASREVSRCPIGTPPTLVVRDVIGHTAQLGTAPPSLHSHARWFAWSSNAGVCRPCSVPHFTWAIESGGDESEGRSQLCRMFEVHRAKRGYPGLLHTDRHWGRRPTSRRRVGNCPTYQRSTVTNLTLVDLGQSVTSRVTRSRDRS